MLELILVRHGETENQISNRYIGLTDVPLSERGKRQALSLARTFAREKPDAVYTSPLLRAKNTAAPIAKSLFVSPVEVAELCDRSYGVWENMTIEEIQDKFPDEYREWYQNWMDYEIPQGESVLQVVERNAIAVRRILESHEKGKIVIVTHEECIRNILALLFDMNVEGAWHFQVNHAGICRLKVDEYGFAVMTSFNEI